MQRVLTGQEAVGNLQDVANRDTALSDVDKAATMAAVGKILRELSAADRAARAQVLTAPNFGPAARLQSLVASGEVGSLTLAPLPAGGFEAKFDTSDWFGWATVAWSKLKNLAPHKMLRPGSSTAAAFPDRGRIAVLGDWATGVYGAPVIAASVRDDRDGFAMLLHLGDVYYSGTPSETQQRFLDIWPVRDDAISRAINSNHEMYSGGTAYFDHTLPRFGQDASYFAVQNRRWTLVGLDTAYHDHAIDDEQVAWLRDIVANAGDRKVILFSHHQLYSHFESQGDMLRSHPGFEAILSSGRIFAWYWGHEHRCTIFEGPDQRFGLLGRCIGHGGMPQNRDATQTLPRADGAVFERADWRRSPPQIRDGNLLPGCVVLEGRNEFIVGEEDKFLPHGYAVLELDGAMLKEQVLDPRGQVIYEKVLASR
jgi:hypothetical protein